MATQAQAGETLATSRIDEEDIRLTTGFADIFTAILLVAGGAILAGVAGGLGGLLIAAAAFALGKPLVRTRRFAACGNVLSFGCAFGAAATFAESLEVLAIGIAAIASLGFWRIHRVPLALALAWMAAIALPLALLSEEPLLSPQATTAALVASVALFAAAMWYDSRDPLRKTRLADVAFWLHLASAPLFVHGLFAALGMDAFSRADANPPVVLAVFLALTLVSLVIDRRPLLASSFLYLVAATAALLRNSWDSGGGGPETGEQILRAAMAPAVIGMLLLVLAAAWTPLRRVILRALPAAVTRRLPPAVRHAAPAAERPQDLPDEEKEPIRLVLGFNDFFVALGAMALFVGTIFIGVQIAWVIIGDWSGADGEQMLRSPELWLPIDLPALAMWLVAEYFVRIRRMAWPAISAAIAFSATGFAGGVLAAVQFAIARRPDLPATGFFGLPAREALSAGVAIQCVLIVCAIGCAANLLFWWRHRVPISFALAAAALLPLIVLDWITAGLAGETEAAAQIAWEPRLLAAGAAAFALAMLWDRTDPARATQRADIAFWLHLLASALAVPALYALAGGSTGGAILIAAGFCILVALALVIDRRAPLAVALPFMLASLNDLFGGASPLVGIGLIAGLLALVLKWEAARGGLIGLTGSQRPA